MIALADIFGLAGNTVELSLDCESFLFSFNLAYFLFLNLIQSDFKLSIQPNSIG